MRRMGVVFQPGQDRIFVRVDHQPLVSGTGGFCFA